MAGIYFHIPFCRKACTYCDFHFVTNLKGIPAMVEAMLKELRYRKNYLGENPLIQSIYFGGGTPSTLSALDISLFLDAISKNFSLAPKPEITLEANPDDLSINYLREIQGAGINRLSVGIQSFRAQDLALMNRSHSESQAKRCIWDAADAGFSNISGDLIFGIPEMSLADWEAQLEEITHLPLTHLSLYALTVEEKTALHHQVKKRTIVIPDDELYQKQFFLADKYLAKKGFSHYELSNYALPNYTSRHNASYWQGTPYLGIGPSAHSFDGKSRSWNISNNALYLKAVNENFSGIEETEILSERDKCNEYLMTHLRKAEGISLSYLKQNFDYNPDASILSYLNEGLLIQEGDRLRCSLEGWLLSDEIIREMFL